MLFPIADAIREALAAFADSLFEAYTWVVMNVISILLQDPRPLFPTTEQLADQPIYTWLLIGMGGTLGIARSLLTLLALVVGIFAILTPLRDHSLRFSRVISSMVIVLLFSVLFFPAYGLAHDVSTGASQAVLNLLMGTEDATTATVLERITEVQQQQNNELNALVRIAVYMTTAFLAGLIGLEASALVTLLYITLFLYPLAWAVRPFGGPFERGIHILHAGLGTILLSPPVMLVGFTAPVVAPLSEIEFFQIIYLLVGSLIALVAPIVMFVFFYKQSSQVFGKVDAGVRGAVDINSIPPLSTQEIQASIEESGSAAFHQFNVSASFKEDPPNVDETTASKMREAAVDGVAVALTGAGHPIAATALNVGDTALKNRAQRKADK